MLAGLDIIAASTRVPSPWDDIIRGSTPSTTSASPTLSSLDLLTNSVDSNDTNLSKRIPRLTPEVEEGNVEYKLKLLDPTPARFARLVTQLKWRLLEGEGQCYYEIGVADSGLLIGLTKQELERSLETLEEMAGEIGASVIVVKEVEVPDALVQLAQKTVQRLSQKGVLDGLEVDEGSTTIEPWPLGFGAWDRRSKREDLSPSSDMSGLLVDEDSPSSSTSDEIDEENLAATVTLPLPKYTALDQDLAFFDTEPDGDVADIGSSHDLALFTFDPEPLLAADVSSSNATSSLPTPSLLLSETSDVSLPDHLVDLSIAEVFKPRPGRRRVHGHSVNGGKLDKRQAKWEKQRAAAAGNPIAKALPAPIVGVEGPTKAEKRRIARDRRREERRLALVSAAEGAQRVEPVTGGEVDGSAYGGSPGSQTADLITGLEDLHVGLAPLSADISPLHGQANNDSDVSIASVDDKTQDALREPRLIVEALVVRKLSAEEAYGPGNFGFEGFDVAE